MFFITSEVITLGDPSIDFLQHLWGFSHDQINIQTSCTPAEIAQTIKNRTRTIETCLKPDTGFLGYQEMEIHFN